MPSRRRAPSSPAILFRSPPRAVVVFLVVVSIELLAIGLVIHQSRDSHEKPVGLMRVDQIAEAVGVPSTPVTPRAPITPAIPVPEPTGPAAAIQPVNESIEQWTGPEIVDGPDEGALPPSDPTPTFDGRPLRHVRTIRMLVTAYSPDERSCGRFADGITASGYSVWTNGMKLVAADTRILPFKSIVTVPGYNGSRPVPVLDRGGKIKGRRLDVLFPTHEIALKWGKKWVDVDVWEYAD